jgi:hypothetical protein
MPELPEVETVRRKILKALAGKRIREVYAEEGGMLPGVTPFCMGENRQDRLAYWVYAAAVLLIALILRAVIFQLPDEENDEMIYRALVEQLHAGLGYTLRGHQLLSANFHDIARTYDAPVFLHPPAGVLYFYAVTKIFGLTRWALRLAQPIAFSAYYLAGLAALDLYFPSLERPCHFVAPLLLAFTPIYAHTNLKVWLENPRLAFFMIHLCFLALYLRAPSRARGAAALITSILPVLTKVDSAAVFPFVCLFANSVFPRNRTFLAALLALNVAVAAGWLFYSEALGYGPGRPPAELLEHNAFLRFFTLELTSGLFLAHFLKLTATLVPSLLALVGLRALAATEERPEPRLALALWIISQLALYGIFGRFGYMKLQRFLILALPATFFLAVLAVNDVVRARKGPIVVALAALLLIGFFTEIGQGVFVILTNGTEASLRPIF